MVSGVVEKFSKRITQELDPKIDKKNVLKFFFYSDHDDSTIHMSTAFKHHLPTYPRFAS
jgi:hypothetical protein